MVLALIAAGSQVIRDQISAGLIGTIAAGAEFEIFIYDIDYIQFLKEYGDISSVDDGSSSDESDYGKQNDDDSST